MKREANGWGGAHTSGTNHLLRRGMIAGGAIVGPGRPIEWVGGGNAVGPSIKRLSDTQS